MTSSNMVIGASGLIGNAVLTALVRRGLDVTGTRCRQSLPDLTHLDLEDSDSILEMVRSLRPAVIYLTAACSNVDYCEAFPDESWRMNVGGVKNVVHAANAVGARVVYLSTDYVFNGIAGPYDEQDLPDPICEYGRQKLIAEHVVGFQAERHLIARTTVAYGPESTGKNFVYRLVRTLRAGSTIDVPDDQIGSPTYAPDLAERLIDLAQLPHNGLFHVCGPDRMSRYQFALLAARVFELPGERIRPVKTPVLSQAARRPLNAGMRIEKLISVSGTPTMSAEEALETMRWQVQA